MKTPPYKPFPTLLGKRIQLRELETSDVHKIIDISFYNARQAKNFDEALEMQARINQDYEKGNSIHWGIFDTTKNQLMGTCGYYRGFNNNTGELGFVMLREFRNRGYMAEAVSLAMKFGFNQIGLKKIIAITTPKNLPAIQMLENLKLARVTDSDADEIKFEILAK